MTTVAADSTTARIIEAAGGVLWRPAGTEISAEVEIALVHRPKYDDWSLPKGKLVKDEHPVVGAVREVREETGTLGVPGRPMGEIHYLKQGVPKRVRYWAMRAEEGRFQPNAEVDELVWLPPGEARQRLLPERDRAILDGVDRAHLDTWPCALLRHGNAGNRSQWPGPDRDRPLDPSGRGQAEGLATLLATYRFGRVVSAGALRCVQTVAPLAASLSLPVEEEPLLAEDVYAREPGQVLDWLVGLVAGSEPAVVCGHGDALDGLATTVSTWLGAGTVGAGTGTADRLRKGQVLVLHLRRTHGDLDVVGVERHR
jgi:8-oxo-dGTP diphosphatase